jgi:hypothetical protein
MKFIERSPPVFDGEIDVEEPAVLVEHTQLVPEVGRASVGLVLQVEGAAKGVSVEVKGPFKANFAARSEGRFDG